MSDESGRGPHEGGFGDSDDDDPRDGDRRRLFERAVPEIIRRLVERAVETGVETLTEGPDHLRKHLGDNIKLPKEVAQYLFEQMDDTKKGLYRVVAKEIRDVLEHISFADEIADVLTKLSFEINTQIRFVPNPVTTKEGTGEGERDEKGAETAESEEERKRKRAIPRPQVVSKVVMKARDIVTSAKDTARDTDKDNETGKNE